MSKTEKRTREEVENYYQLAMNEYDRCRENLNKLKGHASIILAASALVSTLLTYFWRYIPAAFLLIGLSLLVITLIGCLSLLVLHEKAILDPLKIAKVYEKEGFKKEELATEVLTFAIPMNKEVIRRGTWILIISISSLAFGLLSVLIPVFIMVIA